MKPLWFLGFRAIYLNWSPSMVAGAGFEPMVRVGTKASCCALLATSQVPAQLLRSLHPPQAALPRSPPVMTPPRTLAGLITRIAWAQMQHLKRKKEQLPDGSCSFFWLREPDLNRRSGLALRLLAALCLRQAKRLPCFFGRLTPPQAALP